MKPNFPSLDLYPLHDKDGYLEFVLGMWFNTREIAGMPTFVEAVLMFAEWPSERFHELWLALVRNKQVAPIPDEVVERATVEIAARCLEGLVV